MNLLEIIKKFPNQKACIKYLEKIKWENVPTCPYCKSRQSSSRDDLRHTCYQCNSAFSVTVGTIFHHSHVKLQKWFLVISLILNAKKGFSAYQISRDIGLRRTTVWKMMHKIREAMGTEESALLSGIVEMDETYIGGKPRDDGTDNTSKRGRGTDKEVVVGMIERNGKVRVKHSDKKKLKSINLQELVRGNVDLENSILMTDEYRGYSRMNQLLKHFQINHSYEYANGIVHTNTIESFWALLKRGILGQYHRVSAKYLWLYLNEFAYRYNRRNIKSAFEIFLNTLIR